MAVIPEPESRDTLSVLNPVRRTGSAVAGLALALLLALVARWVGGYLPLLGASISGLLLGILVRLAFGLPGVLEPGARMASSQGLKLAIVFLGAGMSLTQVIETGGKAILVVLTVVILGIAVTLFLGRRFGMSKELSQLIGVGTSICGATAIATLSPVIRARQVDTAYAVSTIFAFNLIAVFAYPLIGHALGLGDTAFGMWAGTGIQDTSSVVAAGYAFSDAAGGVATVVKLTRTLFLVPVALLFGLWSARQIGDAEPKSQGKGTDRQGGAALGKSTWQAFPTFLLGFLALALLRTLDLVPAGWMHSLEGLGKFLVVVALVGVGLNSDLGKMRTAGFKPLLLGLAASAVIGLVSLVLTQLFS